ncbi:MAG: PD-(D/E)XK nuclease family protein [Acidobacteria bacterium]|nr:PD-(D/E)XK nuclease family protein [Candidatus Sulfomarinibacter kjeldsenii]
MHRLDETRSRVITCAGARSAERRLLEEIDRLSTSAVEEIGLPLRVVVPSRSLRHHLIRVIARSRGGVAGLQIQTLFGLALEAVARSGLDSPRADAGFEVQVRRLAAAEPTLRGSLDGLTDGYDAVVGAVRDLLDAGFLPGNEDGVLERIEDVAGEVAPERLERSAALVRLAAAAFDEAEELGLRRSTRALQLAEDALQMAGPDLVPTRTLLVHGFADVTGVAADLLVALVRVLGGTVILDRPPDPAVPERDDLGGAYLTRLEERMAHLDRETDEDIDRAPEIELAEAPDVEAEARWVAERIRDLLDRGIEAEEIGVVGRTLELMALPLRRHFHRLGVPFSGVGATVPGAGPRRRLRRLTELLRRGPSAQVDLWIEARAGHSGLTELLLGLRVLGVLRLADLADLPGAAAPPGGVRLPVAFGPEEEIEEDGESRRRLSNEVLGRAVTEAGDLVSVLDGWPAAALTSAHRRHTFQVLAALGWDGDAEESRVVYDALDGLCGELPTGFELSQGEWLKLLGDRLDGVGEVPLGGDGAGVQVMTVMESRARTFGHLHVVGVNRGVFPRVGHEDPMLPEAVRARLAADVLPEMPVKGRSADEERYLFAQLLSSAPSVSLSWHVYGSDGTLTPSPFVDRLRLREGVEDPASITQLWSYGEIDSRPRPAYELAVLEAPTAGARGIGTMLEAAVAEGRADAGSRSNSVPPEEVAAARADLLAAVERPPGATGLSPWFGFSGALVETDDDALWVTHAEGIGTCPWRAFVQRRLGVQPMPDPLLGLPGIDGPLVGQVVHRVLDAIVVNAIEQGGELTEAISRDPVRVRWPSPDTLNELLEQEAHRVAAREGLAPIGMAPLLSARARQFLEVERDLEWGSGVLPTVLGSEVEGWVLVPGVESRLWFRADRVDGEGGAALLVDYKAAKPAVDASTEPFRSNNIRTRIARGRLLQAAAYSRAEGVSSGTGRYLYLKPIDGCKDEIREISVAADNHDFIEPFEAALRAIAAARSQGVAFPRVEEADGTSAGHCGFCPVAEACRRDDSAFRHDLVRWMNSDEGGNDPAIAAARALWWLGFDQQVEGA